MAWLELSLLTLLPFVKLNNRVVLEVVFCLALLWGQAVHAQATEKLPKVLIIGDSISIHSMPFLEDKLMGVAQVVHHEGNAGPTVRGLELIDQWLGEEDWDIIQFNWGLWDMYGWRYENHPRNLVAYENNLQQLVDRLRQTEASLIWATTTPPCVAPERKTGILISDSLEARYLGAAERVMRENGIPINDINAAIRPHRMVWAKAPNDVHFTAEGYQFIAATMAAGIEQAIARASLEPLSLLNYNVRIDFTGESWPRRESGVKAILTQHPFDLVLIQEASEFMIAEYQAMLPDHYYKVGERSDGHRNDQTWYEYNPIFYRPDRLEYLDSGSFWVGEDPLLPGDTLEDSKFHGRVFHWMKLRDRQSGREFVVGNIHIHGQRGEDAMALIVEQVKAQAGDSPIILAGDYNSVPTSQAYADMVSPEVHRFLDAHEISQKVIGPEVTVIGQGEAVPSGSNTQKDGDRARRIDYIFVQPGIEVVSYEIVKTPIQRGLFPSDHFPILMEFRLP